MIKDVQVKLNPRLACKKQHLTKRRRFSPNIGLQGRNFMLFILCSTVHFPQFQPPDTHNCRLYHTNIFENTEVLQIEILFSNSFNNAN